MKSQVARPLLLIARIDQFGARPRQRGLRVGEFEFELPAVPEFVREPGTQRFEVSHTLQHLDPDTGQWALRGQRTGCAHGVADDRSQPVLNGCQQEAPIAGGDIMRRQTTRRLAQRRQTVVRRHVCRSNVWTWRPTV